jgi:cation diffusion facilitator family transporter
MKSQPASMLLAYGHEERQKKTRFVVNLGLACNAVLAAAKLGFGILGHSRALLADGVNSISDVFYFLVVKFFVRLSNKPADTEHPYGHYQYETIAALVVGAFVITTGLAIFWDSINSVFDLASGEMRAAAVKSFTFWIAAGTIVVKVLLMIQARRVGRATNNLAVIALARDHRNDVFASCGVGVGILLSIFGFSWADPIAGAAVAVIVAKTGFSILLESAGELMDTIPGDRLKKQFTDALQDVRFVQGIEEIHAHRFGPYLVANITISIDGALRVAEADAIATATERKLLAEVEMLRKVFVHCHPVKREGSAS